MKPEVYVGTYQGEAAVWLKAGPYEAAVLPGTGANLIALRDVEKGYRIIREPEADELESFLARPMAHGIPVLFPPNRYDGGQFRIGELEYRLPINEPERGNHLHGLCFDQPWETVRTGADERSSYAEFAFERDAIHTDLVQFPHRFRLTLLYTLSADGLRQQVTVHNLSPQPMPCMLGFHTAVNAPFVPGSTNADCRFTMTIGGRWELDDRMLPTGRKQPLSPFEASFRDETTGASPFAEAMDNHYSAVPGPGGNRMMLTDTRANVRLVYEAGGKYRQWMIWNNVASGGFFCPEPQINMVNAPSLRLPVEETGLLLLPPGETWTESSRLYVEAAE